MGVPYLVMTFRFNLAIQQVILCLLVLACFGQILQFEFLNLDDHDYVSRNVWVADGLTPTSIAWAFSTFENPYYMPLTRLSFLLDSSLFGIDARGYHLTNLLLHLVNTLLVLHLIRQLKLPSKVAFFVAALFAVHPQHLEAVAWVAERKEVLSAFFGLSCLLFYARYKQQLQSLDPGKGRLFLILSVLSYLLSLLAKPMWITLPVLLLLLDWWPLRDWSRSAVKRLTLEKLPFLICASLFILLHSVTAPGASGHTITSYGPAELLPRLGHAFAAWALYLIQTLVPWQMNTYVPYPESALPLILMVGAAALMLGLTWVCWLLRNSMPAVTFGWLWFGIGLAPAAGIGLLSLLGLAGVGEAVLICHRFTYMPHFGLFIGLAMLAYALPEHGPVSKKAAAAAGTAVTIAFAATTITIGPYWRDSEAFWQRSIELTDGHFFSHLMLGAHYDDSEQPQAALNEYLTALRQRPADPFISLRIGNVYWQQEDKETAHRYYLRLLNESPAPPTLLHMMALFLRHHENNELAARFMQGAIESGLTSHEFQRNNEQFMKLLAPDSSVTP